MTPEQQRAIALANARARAAAQSAPDAPAPAVAQAVPPAAAPAPFQRAGGYQSAGMAGLADAGIKGYLGLKTILGGLSKEEQGVLRELKAEAEADPNGVQRTAGDIVGNLLMSAVPASKAAGFVSKITGALPAWLAPAATAATVSGAQGLVMNPGQGETWADQMADKTEQSGKDALFGGVLGAGGQLLRKGVTQMFTPKPEAEMLFRQGINPTLQQGADSGAGRFIGGLTSGAVKSHERQLVELENAHLQRITGTPTLPGQTRREALESAENAMDTAYTNFARGRRVPISPTLRRDMAAAADVTTPTGQFGQEAADAQRALANIVPDYPRNINVGYRRLQEDYAYPLSEAAGAQNTERAKQALLRARDLLMEARNRRLTADELAQLRGIDSRNYDMNRFREAVKGAGLEKEGITVDKLEAAYSKVPPMAGNTTREELIGPAARVLGNRSLQDESRTGMVAAKRIVGLGIGGAAMAGNPVGMALSPMYALSLAGQTAPGAKFLMGQYDWQRALADASRRAAPYLAGSGQILSGDE